MSEILSLLKPKVRSASRRLKPAGRGWAARNLALLGVGAGFWMVTFYLTYWFIALARGEAALVALSDLLVEKLFALTFLVFLAVLFFSNVITSFSVMFLADDLELVGRLPVSLQGLFSARLVESMVLSSWMVVVFGSPVFVACGFAYGAEWSYYVWLPVVMILFVVIPGGLGASAALVIARVFPARRAHEVLLVLSFALLVIVFLIVRFLEPEKLVDPASGYSGLGEFLHSLRSSNQSWLPSYWAAEALFPRLRGEAGRSWTYLTALGGWACGAVLLASLSARLMYRRGLTKTHESRGATLSLGSVVELVAGLAAVISPKEYKPVARKDTKTFFRDPGQWSQVMLLGALAAIYVYNFKSFKAVKITGMLGHYFLYFLNLGLGGFVIAAVAARFVYPSISLEGKAFWIIRSSPMSLKTFIKGKLWTALAPLSGLSLVMASGSAWMMDLPPFLALASVLSAIAIGACLTVLAVGIGAVFPAFDAESAAKAAGSFGGVVYMILAGTFLAVFIGGQVLFLPAAAQMVQEGEHLVLFGPKAVTGVSTTLAAAGICLFLPIRIGLRKLSALGIP